MFSKGPVALCNERKPLGLACSACFEELAGVFASSVATLLRKDLCEPENKEWYILILIKIIGHLDISGDGFL